MKTETEQRIEALDSMVFHINHRIAQAKAQIVAAEAAAQPLLNTLRQEAETLKLLLPLEHLLPVIKAAVSDAESKAPRLSIHEALKQTLPGHARNVAPAVWPHVLAVLQGDVLQGIAAAVTAEIASRKAAALEHAREQAARDEAARARR